MDLAEYRFKANYWPPPDDRKAADTYLFGFDEDNQPYIVRWEKQSANKGWVATTLNDHKDTGYSATPRTYEGAAVGKMLTHWADAPCLLRTVFAIRSKKKEA